MGVGCVKFYGRKRYEGVRFNVINIFSVTRRWVEVQFPGGKRYVTLEWLLTPAMKTAPTCIFSKSACNYFRKQPVFARLVRYRRSSVL